jgi:hypothetical protein
VTPGDKPKMGRPRRSKEVASAKITVYLTPTEEQIVIDRAAAESPPLPVSAWVRKRLDLDP